MNVGGITISPKIKDFVDKFVKQIGSLGTKVSAQSILDAADKKKSNNDDNKKEIV